MPAPRPDPPRRRFLRTAAVATAGTLAAPYLRASDKTGRRPPVIGTGAHTYACHHDWGELPRGLVLGLTHGIARDRAGHIYIKHRPHARTARCDAVLEFDPAGRFVRSWGEAYGWGAHGLHHAVEDGAEFLYLCDPRMHQLTKTTLTGEVVWQRGAPAESGCYPTPDTYRPTNVATAPDGTVYVADGYGSNYIHAYSAAGAYRRTFGGTGDTPGRCNCPHGLMVDRRTATPTLLVADRGNGRLQRFSLAGDVLGQTTAELRQPCHFDQRGDLLLIPDLMARVTLFDRDDRLVLHLGDGGDFRPLRRKPRTAFVPGQFIAPHSAIFDEEGNIYVVEWVPIGRITKLQRLT